MVLILMIIKTKKLESFDNSLGKYKRKPNETKL
jgi:hypothetical protein